MSVKKSAAALGMRYESAGDSAFKRAWSSIPEVSRSGKIEHIVFGRLEGVEVTGFQYTMMVHTGQAPIIVQRSIYSCETELLPRTVIRPRNALGRLLRTMGLGKGFATGDPRFDRHFRIDSEDDAFARDLLTDPVRAHVLEKHSVTWRFQDARLCLIYPGKMRDSRIGKSFDRLLTMHHLVEPAIENTIPEL